MTTGSPSAYLPSAIGSILLLRLLACLAHAACAAQHESAAPETVTQKREQLVLRKAGCGGRGNRVVVRRDPAALADSGRGGEVDHGHVHRDPAEHGQFGAVPVEPALARPAAQ